jgi:hypothetical protein
MTYRGIVSNGVVLLEGEKPSEGTVVEVIPVIDSASAVQGLAAHPAVGIWKDRKDLPDDSVQVSKDFRTKLMGQKGE